MVKIPSGKPAYIVCLLLIMLASLGCIISTSFMSAENYMPVINIGDGSAVVTFLISLVVLGIVLKCSEKAAKVTLAAWLSYFFFSQIYEFGTLFTTIITIINGGAGGDINIWPMLIENAGVNFSSTVVALWGIILLVVTIWLGIRLMRFFATGYISNKFFNVLVVIAVISAVAVILALLWLALFAGIPNPVNVIAVLMRIITEVLFLFLFVIVSADIGKDAAKQKQ